MENLYTDTRVLDQNKVMYYHTIFCLILQSAVNAFLDSNVSKGRHGGKGNPIMVSRVSNYSFYPYNKGSPYNNTAESFI